MAIEGVPEEMTAVQVIEFHKPYEIRKIKTPQSLKPYEILLKTAVASLCHTDGMVIEHKFPTKLPATASHEGTGTVVAVGSDVKKFKKGDRVMAGIPTGPCQKCINCTGPDGWAQYCPDFEGMNGVFGADGAFADYLVADSRWSSHVPEKLSLTSAAPLACAGVTIYRALLVSEVAKGGWIAVVGAGGGLGHLGIQMANAMGMNVIAIDARDEGLEVCKKAGAKHVFDARQSKEDVVEQVQKITPENAGVDAAVNVSEHESSAPLSCAITKLHGTVVQVAQPDMVSVPFHELVFRDIHLKGSLVAGPEQGQEMLNMVAEHKIQVETNVFHGLDSVPKMVELSHSGKMKGKAVVVVDEEAIKAEKGKVVA